MEGTALRGPAGGVRRGLRALATAGNAVALVLLVLVLARREVLFGAGDPAPPPAAVRSAPAPASRVLLVVIDALRADRAGRMPRLAALARAGGHGTARVEALIPSTVAGIRALAEGTAPPPASFTEDFGTSAAPQGGIFAAVAGAGLDAFAAGPRLWKDLYGPWLAGAFEVSTLRGDDARVLRAARDALRRHHLVVVHFGETDDAAHLAGAGSRAYTAALARADAALGELLRSAPPGTAVLVTSDHGVTGRGGHAGPEPAVLEVPVIAHGPGLPRGDLGSLRQRDLHRLILRPLGLSLAPAEPPRPAGSGWALLPVLLALAAGLSIWSAVAAGSEPPRAGLALKATLWPSLALAFLAPAGALGLALAALMAVAWWSAGAGGRSSVRSLFLLAAAFAALRLFDALRSLEAPLPLPAPLDLIAVAVLGLGIGAGLRRSPGLVQGFAAAVVPVLLARLFLGETVSLSTLDVRAAFRLVDGAAGLTGAAFAALLRQTFPFLALLLGLLARPPRDGGPMGGSVGGLAAGLGTVLAGQAAVAALVLRPGEDQILGSLGVGLLVRLIGEATALFLGSALLLAAASLTRLAGRSRLPEATLREGTLRRR